MKPISYLLIQIFALSQQNVEAINAIQWSGFNPMIIIELLVLLLCMFLQKLEKQLLIC